MPRRFIAVPAERERQEAAGEPEGEVIRTWAGKGL